VERLSGRELDMGSPFDFFGEISHHGAKGLTREQAANREFLKSIMEAAGFRPYAEEWWHYTLANEPYPDTYFNFPNRQ
jgi:D-alanyl-D-alanine dipeptidase